MGNEKIKILFYNKDVAGVNYYRTLSPAMQLERDFSDSIQVEINPDIEFTTYDETVAYLKQFHIIHYHRFIFPQVHQMVKLARDLRANGTVLVCDIDDYWLLDKTHPLYASAIQTKMHLDIIDNLKIADYITTTTELFADEIRKLVKKDNVMVFHNSVNPEWQKQFQNKRTIDEKYTRVTYSAGSSHENDLKQMIGMTSWLRSMEGIKDRVKFILAGWDTEGFTTDFQFNQEFKYVLEKRRLWKPSIVKQINATRGNVDLMDIPKDIKDRFRGLVFSENKRPINSEESVYLKYEKILTDDYRLLNGNSDYLTWLQKYERDRYNDAANVQYERRWTQKANVYAQVLDETDISVAPLADNQFNRMKSNLKQVEVWSRKLPIICSDIPPYNVDGKHMKNCILVPYTKNSLYNKKVDQDWAKAIKLLMMEPNLREDLGNQLYEDFKVKYNLKHVTALRAEFYHTIAKVNSPVSI